MSFAAITYISAGEGQGIAHNLFVIMRSHDATNKHLESGQSIDRNCDAGWGGVS